jgi:hypothetical protein
MMNYCRIMSHQAWVNKLRDPRLNRSSTNFSSSTTDQNENVQPPQMSQSSENNLRILTEMITVPPPPPPPTSSFVDDNKRKRKMSNPWFNASLFEDIGSINGLEQHIRALEGMGPDEIDPALKKNFLLVCLHLFTVREDKMCHILGFWIDERRSWKAYAGTC